MFIPKLMKIICGTRGCIQAENEDDWNSLWKKKNEYIAKLVDDYTEPLITNSLSSTTNDLVTADDIDEILSPEDFILKKYKQLLSTMESFDNDAFKAIFKFILKSLCPHSDYLSSNVEDFDINMVSLVGIVLSVDGAAKIESLYQVVLLKKMDDLNLG